MPTIKCKATKIMMLLVHFRKVHTVQYSIKYYTWIQLVCYRPPGLNAYDSDSKQLSKCVDMSVHCICISYWFDISIVVCGYCFKPTNHVCRPRVHKSTSFTSSTHHNDRQIDVIDPGSTIRNTKLLENPRIKQSQLRVHQMSSNRQFLSAIST